MRMIAPLVVALFFCNAAAAAPLCSVYSTGLAFGEIDTMRGQRSSSSGRLVVRCSGNPGETVHLQLMLAAPKTSLDGATESLDFAIFLDAARNIPLGDGTRGTQAIDDSFTLSTRVMEKAYPVYGVLQPRNRLARAGTYKSELYLVMSY